MGWIQGGEVWPPIDWYQRHANPWVVILICYLLGALSAELTAHRAELRRHASVVPRQVSDYLSPWLHRSLMALPLVLLILVALPTVVPAQPSWPSPPQPADFVAGAVGGLVALLITEAVLRRIVHRPQRIADPDLLRTDDALRSGAAHAVTAAAVALQLLAVSSGLWTLGASAGPAALRWTLPWLGTASLLAAFSVWANHGITTFRWSVPRLRSRPS